MHANIIITAYLEGQSALKKGYGGRFDFIITEKDSWSKMCLRFELEK